MGYFAALLGYAQNPINVSMDARILIMISLGFFAATPSQAGWWDCVCLLVRSACELPDAQILRQSAIKNISAANVGDTVRIQTGKKFLEGILVESTFEEVVVEATKNDKPTRIELPHNKIADIRVLEKSKRGDAKTKILQERLEARRLYIKFLGTDFWTPIKDPLENEITELRTLKDTEAQKSYLRRVGQVILEKVRTHYKVENLGFHFNLHGGDGYGYTNRGGILISRGDAGLQYGVSRDIAEKVYFFQSKNTGLYEILDQADLKLLTGGRMGNELNIFALDSDYIERAKKEGGISSLNEISFDFNPAWLQKQNFNKVGRGLVGIPYSIYLAPPIPVFRALSKKFQNMGSLSRDEITLITMRQLEAILLSDQNWVGASRSFKKR